MKWVIAGASNIAREWVCQAIRAMGDDIVCLVSGNKERGNAFAAECKIATCCDNLEQALSTVQADAVYVSSQNHLHYPQTMLALRHGKAVMCEKPIALNLTDARSMRDFAKAHHCLLAVNHHLRNASTIKEIRRLISSNAIGDVLTINLRHAVYLPENLQGWRINDLRGGGVILDITVHDADTLRFILNDDPVSANAMIQAGRLSDKNIAETVMGTLRFQQGTLVNFYDSFTARHTQTGMTIIGTQGTIEANNVMTQQPVGEIYLINAQGRQQISVQHENLYLHSFRCFRQAMDGKTPPAASAEDGIWSLKTALAVAQAAQSQQTVLIDKESL